MSRATPNASVAPMNRCGAFEPCDDMIPRQCQRLSCHVGPCYYDHVPEGSAMAGTAPSSSVAALLDRLQRLEDRVSELESPSDVTGCSG